MHRSGVVSEIGVQRRDRQMHRHAHDITWHLTCGGMTLPGQPHCNVVQGLIPLLTNIGWVPSWATAGGKTIDVSFR